MMSVSATSARKPVVSLSATQPMTASHSPLDVPVTPMREAVRQTVEVFRSRLAQDDLDPETHGLEAAVAST